MITKSFTFGVLRCLLVAVVVFIGGLTVTPNDAMAETVCSRAGSEFDFNGGYIFGGDVTSGMRAKLGNANYFGPGGTVAPESLDFSTLSVLNASTLSACTIYIGGGFEEDGTGGTGTLSIAEANALKTWSDLGGDRFVIGGCDRGSNRTCTSFNRSLTQIGNAAITVNGGLANNPLTCGGGGSPLTFGGVSTDIGTLAGDAVLATHTLATSSGEPAATSDSVLNPTFLFTADADMFGSSGNATIGNSPIASNDQAIFLLNTFKFALDGIRGRLTNPFCPTDYNTTTDLELALSGTSAGTTTTVTIEVANTSGTTVSDVEVTAPIPAGFTFQSASGTGSYNSGTGKWIVGTLNSTSSTTITLTLIRTGATPPQMTAEITRQSLPDIDSAPNSGFTADDLADGLADDDEATLYFMDFGDAPVAFGTPSHVINSAIRLGVNIDGEASTQNSVEANGDDNSGSDDEDGVSSFPAITALGTSYRLPSADITASGDGILHGWIDFDGDGIFQSTEHTSVTVAGGVLSNDLFWKGQTIMGAGTTFVRLRFTSDTGVTAATPAGIASDGEVEDYQVTVATPPASPSVPLAVCAAPNFSGITPDGLEDRAFPTGYWAGSYYEGNDGIVGASGGWDQPRTGSNTIGPKSFHGEAFWGAGENPVENASNGSNSNGAWTQNENPTSPLLPHPTYQGSTWLPNGNPWYQIDFRRTVDLDGTVSLGGGANSYTDDTVEVFVNGVRVYGAFPGGSDAYPSSSNRAQVSVSAGNEILIRFINLGFIGGYDFTFVAPGYDCSDAPAVYNTAFHEASAGTIRLGAEVDIDSVNLASADANADGTDDDGVALPASFAPGTTVTLPVTVQGSGFLNAWIDWNGNGVFDSIEQIAADVQDTGGAGIISLPVTVPADAVVGQTFARFRWSSAFDIGFDGAAPDGEVEDYQVTISGGSFLSGQVFVDNGIGGGAAHDGTVNGTETGIAQATVSLYDDTNGTLLAMPPLAGDGTWMATLPSGFNGTVRLEVVPAPAYRTISEGTTGVPTATNTVARDGVYSFTYTSGTSQSGLDVGLIEQPTLTQNQSAAIVSGQIVELPHVYTATTSGVVNFALLDQIANPSGAFASTVFEDTDCDGAADQVMPANKAIGAGQQICLVVRTQASAGVGPGASYTYGITAATTYATTTITDTVRNDDAIGSEGSGELKLEKTVRNESKATPEGTTNSGDLGDVLEYRLILSNPSGQPANNVTVKDRTPAFTSLSASITSPVTVVPGVTCALTVPAANVAGYAGPLEWNCPGQFPPGGLGSLTFRVTISP